MVMLLHFAHIYRGNACLLGYFLACSGSTVSVRSKCMGLLFRYLIPFLYNNNKSHLNSAVTQIYDDINGFLEQNLQTIAVLFMYIDVII
jgi:hypothetical protein